MAREASRDDRRVTLVRPTPAGYEALETFAMIRGSDLIRRLEALGEDERATLTALLERVAATPEADE